MKKNISILLSTLLAIILVAGFVVADVALSFSKDVLTFRIEDISDSFTIANTGNEDMNVTLPSVQTITDGSNTLSFTFVPASLDDVTNSTAPVSVNVNITSGD